MEKIIFAICKEVVKRGIGESFEDINCDGVNCESCPFRGSACSDAIEDPQLVIAERYMNNYKSKGLTFKEVIAEIKKGEVWENCGNDWNIKEIRYSSKEDSGNYNDGIKIIFGESVPSYTFQDSGVFRPKRKQYTFEEAFKAYEEDKEIESCISGDVSYKPDWKGNDEDKYFSVEDIRGKWYINS